MKNLTKIIIIIFFSKFSFAQTLLLPINIEDYDPTNAIADAYYKDINNIFDPFMGTWKYTSPDGQTAFTIVLTKREMLYTGLFYTDYVIGEYNYHNNNIDVNTLSNTSINDVGIEGRNIINSHNRPYCFDCSSGEKRLGLMIGDTLRHLYGTFTLRLITVNGLLAIEGLIYGEGVPAYEANNPPPYFEMRIPTGTFVFIKQ